MKFIIVLRAGLQTVVNVLIMNCVTPLINPLLRGPNPLTTGIQTHKDEWYNYLT